MAITTKLRSIVMIGFNKAFFIVMDYIRYTPLVLVFCYFVFLLLALVIGTDFEVLLIQIFRLFLNNNDAVFVLDKKNVSEVSFKIWFTLATFYQILARFIRLKMSNKTVFMIVTFILFGLSLVVSIKLGVYGVVLVLYFFSVISLGIYFLLSYLTDFLDTLLNKENNFHNV